MENETEIVCAPVGRGRGRAKMNLDNNRSPAPCKETEIVFAPHIIARGRGRGKRSPLQSDSVVLESESCNLPKSPSSIHYNSESTVSTASNHDLTSGPGSLVSEDAPPNTKGETVVLKSFGRGRGRGNPLTLESVAESRPLKFNTPTSVYKPVYNYSSYYSGDDSSSSLGSAASSDNSDDDVIPLPTSRESVSRKKGQKLPFSALYCPKYLEPVGSPERLKKLIAAEVKLLEVADGNGNVVVAFRDDLSVQRFEVLLKKMMRFYMTPEGYCFKIKIENLEVGQIVAASVYLCPTDERVIRRVKVLKVLNQYGKFHAYGVDIDDRTHWHFWGAFALHRHFYSHPAQACNLKISNYEDIYPKHILEGLFEKGEDFRHVMNQLTYKVLSSLIGRRLYISNLSSPASESTTQVFFGELDTHVNWRLKDYYIEEFWNYAVPRIPEIGVLTSGELMYVSSNGNVGVCLENSFYERIKQLTSSDSVKNWAAQLTENDTLKLVKQMEAGESKLFLAYENNRRNDIVRVKITSNLQNKITGRYLDTTEASYINPGDLICAVTNNPDVPAVLAALPPQAILVHLSNADYLKEEQCRSLIGLKVKFKITGKRLIDKKLVDEAEIFSADASSLSSTSNLLNQILEDIFLLRL